MNPYTQTASQMLREAALHNCKEICKVMNQPEDLYKEKFNALLKQVDKGENTAYMSPEEMYRRIYNLSVIKLNQLKERLQ